MCRRLAMCILDQGLLWHICHTQLPRIRSTTVVPCHHHHHHHHDSGYHHRQTAAAAVAVAADAPAAEAANSLAEAASTNGRLMIPLAPVCSNLTPNSS